MKAVIMHADAQKLIEQRARETQKAKEARTIKRARNETALYTQRTACMMITKPDKHDKNSSKVRYPTRSNTVS